MKGGLRILLLEDNRSDARLILAELRRAGVRFETTVVDNELDFIAALGAEPDLILADFNLPQFDALQALGRLREAELEIPVIVVSGTVGEEMAVETIRAGAVDYLLKDRLGRLAPAVRRAVAERRLRLAKREAEAALVESAERVRAILDAVADGIVTIDDRGTVESVNPAAFALFDYPDGGIPGKQLATLIAKTERGEFVRRLRDGLSSERRPASMETLIETRGRRPDGTTFPLEVRVSQARFGKRRLAVGVMRDISERKAYVETLEQQALHDILTALPNRAHFSQYVQHQILGAAREKRRVAVLLMDLDRFKDVNDSLGHQAGDLLLKQLGDRLQAALRASDMVARLGGDEFGVLVVGSHPRAEAQVVGRKLLSVLERPFELDGQSVYTGASIGIATYPEHGADVDALMRRADIAMYAAKREGRGVVVYRPGQDGSSTDRLALLGELKQGIPRGELTIHYQPKIDLRAGQPVAAEALVRWLHPRLGLLMPAQFIEVAEQSDAGAALGRWVLKEALGQAHRWHDMGLELGISVNLSSRNLRDESLVSDVARERARMGDRPGGLTVEITERDLVAQAEHGALRRLMRAGIGVSVDDFGTGYSALGYLLKIPATEIKIDRSFVSSLRRVEDGLIVRPLIEIAHNLGLNVVAEGVERPETVEVLRELGCDFAQGNHLCRPLPPAQLDLWLRSAQGDPGLARARRRP